MFLPCVVGFVCFLVPRHGRRKVAVSGPGNGVFVHELPGSLPEGCGSVEPNHEEEEEEVAASRLGVVLLYQPCADQSFRPLACCLQLQQQQHWNYTHAYYNGLRKRVERILSENDLGTQKALGRIAYWEDELSGRTTVERMSISHLLVWW